MARILIVFLIPVAVAGCTGLNRRHDNTYRMPHTVEELPYETAVDAVVRRLESEETRKKLGVDSRLRVLAIELPKMPQDAVDRYVAGHVFVRFTIAESGSVESPEIASSPDEALSECVLKAMRAWRFSPVTKGGEIVSLKTDTRFTFRFPS